MLRSLGRRGTAVLFGVAAAVVAVSDVVLGAEVRWELVGVLLAVGTVVVLLLPRRTGSNKPDA